MVPGLRRARGRGRRAPHRWRAPWRSARMLVFSSTVTRTQERELGEHRAAEHGVGVAGHGETVPLLVVQQQEQQVLREQRHVTNVTASQPSETHSYASPMTKVLSAVAWPYANGPRHIGHVAGFGVPSDVFSRYQRMAGHDVLMVSGSDEHGTPILIAADEAGVTPAGARRHQPPAHRRGPRRARAAPTTSTRARRPATTTPSCRSCSSASTRTATSSSRRRTAPSRRPPAAPCRTATSRAPARSAGTTARAATSATTAATSSTRPT